MLWYARSLEIAACPRQSSRIQGSGHRRTRRRPRCRHEDHPMGAGKPGLQRPRKDRRFPPPGVTPVPSYGWPPYKRGAAHGGGARGGASLQPPQRSTLRGRSPRRCGPGCARESVLDASWHGLPASSGVKPRGPPASRVHPLARRVVAPHRRGRKWRERPWVFWRWCATGEGEVVHAKIHHHPSPFWGRSLHSDPWREGRNAEDLDLGCPAQPGFDCRRTSSLAPAGRSSRCALQSTEQCRQILTNTVVLFTLNSHRFW